MTPDAKIHHFLLPFATNIPSRNRNMVIAPIYIGPAVNGCGPQYSGRWDRVSFNSRPLYPDCLSNWPVAESSSNEPAEAPPLKFGIIRFGISLMPYDQAVA